MRELGLDFVAGLIMADNADNEGIRQNSGAVLLRPTMGLSSLSACRRASYLQGRLVGSRASTLDRCAYYFVNPLIQFKSLSHQICL